MNRIAAFVNDHSRMAWGIVLALSILTAVGVRPLPKEARLSGLKTIGQSYGTDGVFLVGSDGVLTSS